MNNLKIFSKFLDQPIAISKLNKAMPAIMTTGAGMILANSAIDTFQKENITESKKELIKKGIILTTSITSALLAPKIASKLTKRAPLETIQEIYTRNSKLIEEFNSNNPTDNKTTSLLIKAKDKILSPKELKTLSENLNNEDGKNLLQNLIPDPENIKAKDIFSEIGYLSIYGAIPVVGGILGGIAADIATKEDCKSNIPDKVNEGIYQYLANIFMCNIGVGLALSALEKAKITSEAARATAMTSGIILTGILGGSKIANKISEKIINPLIFKNTKPKERKPEAVDMCLHMDDIATVSLLSGLKWIEPALPILYSVSGYKAGIGYRN